MKIFNLVNFKVEIEPEVLLLAPFSSLWKRDKTKDKLVAKAELAYIWFMQDTKSDFLSIPDEVERSREVIAVLELPKDWKPDAKVKEAEEFYLKASETLAHRLLRDSRAGAEKVSQLLRDPDFENTDMKKVVDTIRILPQLIEAINKIEETVLKEQEMHSHRGSQERALFEDGV